MKKIEVVDFANELIRPFSDLKGVLHECPADQHLTASEVLGLVGAGVELAQMKIRKFAKEE
jgi:hypothetical protein